MSINQKRADTRMSAPPFFFSLAAGRELRTQAY
jgi:hypothetical protein